MRGEAWSETGGTFLDGDEGLTIIIISSSEEEVRRHKTNTREAALVSDGSNIEQETTAISKIMTICLICR